MNPNVTPLVFLWAALGASGFVGLIYFIAWVGTPRERLRIDWERVYAIERDIWGQTFEHAGAPPQRWTPEKLAPTGISTHYNPFSNPSGYLTPNEYRERLSIEPYAEYEARQRRAAASLAKAREGGHSVYDD